MKLIFSEDRLTLGDLLQIEDGRTNRQVAQFLAKFVVDEAGVYVEKAEAWKFVCGMTIPESREAMGKFWEFIRSLREGAVNPTNAAS